MLGKQTISGYECCHAPPLRVSLQLYEQLSMWLVWSDVVSVVREEFDLYLG